MKIKDFNKQLKQYSVKNKEYLESQTQAIIQHKKLKQNNGKNIIFKN